ncbi:MAG: xanthosine utilization system XapX-like protein [Limisphaerales bacterium]
MKRSNEAPGIIRTHRKKIVIGVTLLSYLGLAAGVVWAARSGLFTPEQALLLLVGLFGLYIGFGILIVVYRLINKLD